MIQHIMKIKTTVLTLMLLSVVSIACHRIHPSGAKSGENCYTGVLKIKGMCGQRVIAVLDKNTSIETDSVWVNPGKGDTLQYVFSVSNVCDFPSTIKAGDTLKFYLSTAKEKECVVCMAYTPVPEVKNKIQVGCDPGKLKVKR